MSVRALILAAGEGRRFGGPKQLAVVRGRPLLAHVLDAAAPWEPLVVLGAHAEKIRAAFPGLRSVLCTNWAEGQAASLRAGAAALGPEVEAAIVLLADMPGVTGAVVAGALEQMRSHPPPDAVRTMYAGRPGHPVILGRPVLAAVPSLRGDVGARELLRSFKVHEWEAGQLADPTDIDTPDQLEALT